MYIYQLTCPPYGQQKQAMMPAKRLVWLLTGLQGLAGEFSSMQAGIRYARHRQLVELSSQNSWEQASEWLKD